MKKHSVFEFDPILPLSVVGLIIIGILFIYSSGISSEGINYSDEYIKQILWAVTGVILMVGFSLFDYGRLKGLSRYVYAILLLLLLITLKFGRVVNGAKSWLSLGPLGFQPSEFAKIATILFLAKYLSDTQKSSNELKRFFIALMIAMIPMGLVLIQPDMGTSLVFFPIALVMMFLAGISLRYLVFIFLLGVMTVIIVVLPPWQEYIVGREVRAFQFLINPDFLIHTMGATGLILLLSMAGYLFIKKRYYYWIAYSSSLFLTSLLGALGGRRVLKGYQLKRLIVFMDPGVDPQGAGWNVIQSITAVGSGGFMGRGYLKGTQSHYQFLPQQSTDFIFSIIAEEWGFIGCTLIFLLFLIILVRSLYMLNASKDSYGLYIGGGVVALIFFHFLVNIGMAIGIMPITGIPLIFLSYGGTALWTGLIGLGLIMNVYGHRYRSS